jgi:hypothetical protein
MAKRKGAAKKAARSSRVTGGRKATRANSRGGRRTAAAKASARKTAGRKKAARKSTAKAAGGRKATAAKASTRRSAPSSAGRGGAARKGPARRVPPKTVVARKAPGLDRERRTIRDEDVEASVPSSLDLDRRASAARTGRRELREKFNEHTETSPALTGGDIDADWESAYAVGDEAPGGDNPTPDQDIVDDIGRAVGNEYQDNEELKGADKITKRDKHRWELDPASSEDYDDR